MAWTGSLDNYRDLCELYSGCDRLMSQNDPAQLVLTLYLQGYKDLYNDNSSQPQTWLAAAEVRVRCLRLHACTKSECRGQSTSYLACDAEGFNTSDAG